MALYDDPTHSIDIYLPLAPTIDAGGGVTLNWSSTPDQSACPCIINTTGANTVTRYGQGGISVYSQIGILTETLSVTLVRGTKFVATDTGRTFIMDGLRSPNRQYGTIPPLTYVTVYEQL